MTRSIARSLCNSWVSCNDCFSFLFSFVRCPCNVFNVIVSP